MNILHCVSGHGFLASLAQTDQNGNMVIGDSLKHPAGQAVCSISLDCPVEPGNDWIELPPKIGVRGRLLRGGRVMTNEEFVTVSSPEC